MLISMVVTVALGTAMVLARSVAPMVTVWLALRACPPERRPEILMALGPNLAALRSADTVARIGDAGPVDRA